MAEDPLQQPNCTSHIAKQQYILDEWIKMVEEKWIFVKPKERGLDSFQQVKCYQNDIQTTADTKKQHDWYCKIKEILSRDFNFGVVTQYFKTCTGMDFYDSTKDFLQNGSYTLFVGMADAYFEKLDPKSLCFSLDWLRLHGPKIETFFEINSDELFQIPFTMVKQKLSLMKPTLVNNENAASRIIDMINEIGKKDAFWFDSYGGGVGKEQVALAEFELKKLNLDIDEAELSLYHLNRRKCVAKAMVNILLQYYLLDGYRLSVTSFREYKSRKRGVEGQDALGNSKKRKNARSESNTSVKKQKIVSNERQIADCISSMASSSNTDISIIVNSHPQLYLVPDRVPINKLAPIVAQIYNITETATFPKEFQFDDLKLVKVPRSSYRKIQNCTNAFEVQLLWESHLSTTNYLIQK